MYFYREAKPSVSSAFTESFSHNTCPRLAGLLGSHAPGSFLATVGASLVVVSACGGAFAAGVPVALMPAPLVAASGLVLWYESSHPRDYAIFAAGALATAAWFVAHHFWFLEVRPTSPCRSTCAELLQAFAGPYSADVTGLETLRLCMFF